jgi:hypothetical protein
MIIEAHLGIIMALEVVLDWMDYQGLDEEFLGPCLWGGKKRKALEHEEVVEAVVLDEVDI